MSPRVILFRFKTTAPIDRNFAYICWSSSTVGHTQQHLYSCVYWFKNLRPTLKRATVTKTMVITRVRNCHVKRTSSPLSNSTRSFLSLMFYIKVPRVVCARFGAAASRYPIRTPTKKRSDFRTQSWPWSGLTSPCLYTTAGSPRTNHWRTITSHG